MTTSTSEAEAAVIRDTHDQPSAVLGRKEVPSHHQEKTTSPGNKLCTTEQQVAGAIDQIRSEAQQSSVSADLQSDYATAGCDEFSIQQQALAYCDSKHGRDMPANRDPPQQDDKAEVSQFSPKFQTQLCNDVILVQMMSWEKRFVVIYM